MTTDPASLDNLQDIVELPPVSWWPLASGWWFVIGAAGILATAIAFRSWKNWQAAAYRRAALAELEATTNAADIADLLKRTSLAAYPRTDIASLAGSQWVDWLAETCRGIPVSDSVRRTLAIEVFRHEEVVDQRELKTFARNWIQGHRCHPARPHQEAGLTMLIFMYSWTFALLPLPFLYRYFMPPGEGDETSNTSAVYAAIAAVGRTRRDRADEYHAVSNRQRHLAAHSYIVGPTAVA